MIDSNALLDVLWGALIYVLLPTALGSAAALWFWLKRRMIIGNAIGSAVIAVIMIVFIVQRFADSFTQTATQPDAIFIPLLVLVGLGWLDVLIMFFISGAVEDRVKRRIVNPDDF
jgi:hypothetical protein